MKTQLCRVPFLVLSLVAGCATLLAQQPLNRGLTYERLIAVVPMIGAGTYEDPRRPAYVPDSLLGGGVPKQALDTTTLDTTDTTTSLVDSGQAQGEAPKVIIGFSYELSDDEQFALVTFQATDRSAFQTLLDAAKAPGASPEAGANRNALAGGYDLIVFEVGKVEPTDIETALRQYKANLNLDQLGASLP
jgi:hypothetical protein